MPKLVLNKGSGQYVLTVPLAIVKLLGWQPGERIEFRQGKQGKVFLEKESAQASK